MEGWRTFEQLLSLIIIPVLFLLLRSCKTAFLFIQIACGSQLKSDEMFTPKCWSQEFLLVSSNLSKEGWKEIRKRLIQNEPREVKNNMNGERNVSTLHRCARRELTWSRCLMFLYTILQCLIFMHSYIHCNVMQPSFWWRIEELNSALPGFILHQWTSVCWSIAIFTSRPVSECI